MKYTILQAPALTEYEAATAKVLGPDRVLEARTLQGQYRVYEGLDGETAQRIIDENRKVWEARFSYQGEEKVKGACFIREDPCGCVFELDDKADAQVGKFQTCQQHSQREGWCCWKSVTYHCACMMAQWCPEHGDQHRGSHD